jgi:antitoxin (DNA-binding transcriptional repressor) of toxin-antitoxin stability system
MTAARAARVEAKGAAMTEVSVTEAKARLSELLKRAQAGESFVITRRGRPVARISAPEKAVKPVPSRADFRASVSRQGGSLVEELIKMRDEYRY